jgi:hypothetical protein
MIARAKLASAHADAVHRGAVRRIEVLEDPASIAKHEACMPTRNGGIANNYIAGMAAPNEELGFRAVPIERPQIHRSGCTPAGAAETTANCIRQLAQPPAQSAGGRPGRQISDQSAWVDPIRPQGLVKPMQERVLAEQTLTVRNRERSSDLLSRRS